MQRPYRRPQPRCLLTAPVPLTSPLPPTHTYVHTHTKAPVHTCIRLCPRHTWIKDPQQTSCNPHFIHSECQEAPRIGGPGPWGEGGWGSSWRSGRHLAGATACHGCDAQTAPGGEGPRSRCCPCNPPSPVGTAAHGSRGTGTQPICRQRCGGET